MMSVNAAPRSLPPPPINTPAHANLLYDLLLAAHVPRLADAVASEESFCLERLCETKALAARDMGTMGMASFTPVYHFIHGGVPIASFWVDTEMHSKAAVRTVVVAHIRVGC